jgi:hypothetical protein
MRRKYAEKEGKMEAMNMIEEEEAKSESEN